MSFANRIKYLYLDHPEFLVSNERLDRPFGTRRREATEEVLLVVLEAQEPQLVHFLPLVQHDLMYLWVQGVPRKLHFQLCSKFKMQKKRTNKPGNPGGPSAPFIPFSPILPVSPF